MLQEVYAEASESREEMKKQSKRIADVSGYSGLASERVGCKFVHSRKRNCRSYTRVHRPPVKLKVNFHVIDI